MLVENRDFYPSFLVGILPKKLECCGYPMVKIIFEDTVSLLVSTEYTNVTDGRTPHDGTSRAYV